MPIIPPSNSNSNREKSNLVKFSGMGFQMIATIGIFAFAGYEIDKSMQNKVQWATAGLSLIGVFISLYIIIRSVKE